MDIKTAKEIINTHKPEYLQKAKKKGYICPVCGNGTGKDGDGIVLQPDGTHYKCFKCGLAGDNLDLIGANYNLQNFIERVKKGCEIYGLQLDEWEPENSKTESRPAAPAADPQEPEENQEDFTPQLKQWKENIKKPGNPGLIYLQGRGLSAEIINRFNIGYCENWTHPKAQNAPATPRVIIPTSKYSYLARDIRKQIPEEQQKYSKTKAGKIHFIGIGNVFESETPVFLVEGEIDAISIYEAGGIAVAVGSTAYTGKFLEALDSMRRMYRKSFPQPFVIALDNDTAGRKAAGELADGLTERGAKVFHINPCGNSKDANEALTASREEFIENIRGINIDPAAWVKRQENKTLDTLQGFINGIAESVNTPAIPTGFEKLDAALDRGLYEGLYTLIARTGAGKTTFALQIADQIAQTGKTVFYYNLEMSTAELMAKSVSRLTLINSLNGEEGSPKTVRGITDGRRYQTIIDAAGNTLQWGYSEADKSLINLSLQDYSEYAGNLRFFEKIGYIDTDEIRQDVAFETKLTGTPPVIIVDYLQMLSLGIGLNSATKGLTEYSAINKAVLDLKTISRDFKTPVIAISSMNREGTKSGKAAGLENALGSGSIDYTADVSLILEYADAEEGSLDLDEIDNRETRDMIVKIAKNRNGTRGEKIYFDYTPAYNYFTESKAATIAAKSDIGRITF